MSKIKIAILGAGGMGEVHANSLSKIKDVEISAVCSFEIADAEKLSEKFSCNAYDCLDTMLSENDLNAVFICIPPYAHNGQFEKIAAKNIHIFIEKPIHLHLEKAKSMLEAAEKNKIYTQVGYYNRFGHAVRELKRRIDLGLSGKPVLFTGAYLCNSLHSSWWRDKSKSGSQVLEQVIHIYDLSLYFFGAAEKTTAYMANLCHQDIDNYTVEDVSAAIVKYANGALGSICATNTAVPNRWDNPLTVVFEKLTVQFVNGNEAIFTDTSKEEATVEHISAKANMYDEQALHFIETILGKKENICTIVEGYNSLQLVDSVVKSAENGVEIKIN